MHVHPSTVFGRHALHDGVHRGIRLGSCCVCPSLSLSGLKRGEGRSIRFVWAIWCSWLRGDEGGSGRERSRLETLTEAPTGPVNPLCLGNGFAPAGGGREIAQALGA
ncbi:hypothetical protein CGRA01v4_07518 [Colletotrichum graminicola]|nr:hypothetical protein CGRA01v4_07518 [Colletotrichum graminicola]